MQHRSPDDEEVWQGAGQGVGVSIHDKFSL
jgi:hypothetical protein